MNREKGFQTNYNSGFCITFDNGWTISVQWGPMTQSKHNDFPGVRHTSNSAEEFSDWVNSPHNEENLAHGWKSTSAEIAIFQGSSIEKALNPYTLQPPKGDDYQEVMGWTSPEKVAELIHFVSKIQPQQSPYDELMDMVDVVIDTSKKGGKELLKKLIPNK